MYDIRTVSQSLYSTISKHCHRKMGLLSNCVLVFVNVMLSVVLIPQIGQGEALIISVFSWQNVKREKCEQLN